MFIKNVDAEKHLSNYFDDAKINLEELMQATGGEFLVFGGAVRDAFTGESKCRDIDMIVQPDFNIDKMDKFRIVKNNVGDTYQFARGKRIKYDSNNVISIDIMWDKQGKRMSLFDMFNIVKGVDISISGIAWHPYANFIEVIPDAIKFCSRRIFKVNATAPGYHPISTPERIAKLVSKDWLQIN